MARTTSSPAPAPGWVLALALAAGVLAAVTTALAVPYTADVPALQLTAVGCAFVTVLVIPLIWFPLSFRQKLASTVLAVLVAALPILVALTPPASPLPAAHSGEALVAAAAALVVWVFPTPTSVIVAAVWVLSAAVGVATVGALAALIRSPRR